MTIDEIYKNKEISVRAYNVSKNNSLDTIDKLKEYYLINNSFKKLRNCGYKSNDELIQLCNKYQTTEENNTIKETEKNNHALEQINSNLTRTQREIINSFILVNTNSLSARSKNAISIILEKNFSVRNFTEKILLDKQFKVENIKHVGERSIPELYIYISIVRDFIKEVYETIDDKQLITLKNNFLIQRTFSISKIPIEILESESIFQLTNFLLKNNILFNKNYNLIIQKALKIYQNGREYTLDEIASENNLSRERVRQIRKKCINELFEKIVFIKNFNDDLFQNYGIDLSLNLIEVEDHLVNQINTLCKTDFSKEFTSYILAVYLSDYFVIIGNIEDVLLPKISNDRNRHNWNNFYIVNKELSKVDFTSFTNDVGERLNERIEETYYFNFKSYLSRFLIEIDLEIIDLALPVAEKIINDEFALYLDVDDNIVFKRNTIKQVFEFVIDVLDEIGKPAKLDEIYNEVEKKQPGITKSKESLRGSLLRTPEIICFGRSSTYGLRKWETEIKNIKGGTIRSISTEFLEQYDNPKHISEITAYVLKYRPNSNEKSIYYNLRIDESKTFTFFKNSYIGLVSKRYSDDFDDLKNSVGIVRKPWNERYNDLINFIKINNVLPYYNSSDPEEKTLFKWLNNQKHSKKLSEDQKRLIKEIIEP